IRFSWNELKTLKDADLFCNKFEEQTDWKVEAECTIGNIKDKLENGETPVHQRLLEKLCGIDINDLKCDDPLSNGVIDLGSDRFEISENDFDLLVGEKAGIRRLSKSASIKNICAEFVRRRDEFQEIYKLVIAEDVNVVHYRWVEQEIDKIKFLPSSF
ncbi:28041_t:CDS:2, partial [Dentiscutata erythropus]